MSSQLLRSQLSPQDRELFDLNYLDPSEIEKFARNLVTDLFPTDIEGAQRPLVTIYAAPVLSIEVGHSLLLRRIQDPGLKNYAPAMEAGPLVPGISRPFGGGVIAHDGNRGLREMTSAFVLRTSGSVELIDGEATAASDGRSTLYLRHTLIHTAQVLSYLLLFGEKLERDEWGVTVNVRDAARATLGDQHERYQRGFSTEPHHTLERHLQFRASVHRSDEERNRATIQRLDEFLSFAFGYREPRGHDGNGWLAQR